MQNLTQDERATEEILALKRVLVQVEK